MDAVLTYDTLDVHEAAEGVLLVEINRAANANSIRTTPEQMHAEQRRAAERDPAYARIFEGADGHD